MLRTLFEPLIKGNDFAAVDRVIRSRGEALGWDAQSITCVPNYIGCAVICATSLRPVICFNSLSQRRMHRQRVGADSIFVRCVLAIASQAEPRWPIIWIKARMLAMSLRSGCFWRIEMKTGKIMPSALLMAAAPASPAAAGWKLLAGRAPVQIGAMTVTPVTDRNRAAAKPGQ